MARKKFSSLTATNLPATSELASCGVVASRSMPPSLQAARFLWQPGLYHFILLDVRRHFPGEALEFYEHIRTASPEEHFVFLIGPPAYLSLTWPDDVTAVEKKRQRRAEKVKGFLAAA